MDMILFEVFLKIIELIPQQQILQQHYSFIIIDNVIVLSDLVESSGYSSKTLQKGSCPYAALDEVLRYGAFTIGYLVVCKFKGPYYPWHNFKNLIQEK